MKTIAIVNQKGGVSKTTTALCLGAGFHRAGLKVLHVDLDSQGSLSLCLGAAQGPNIFDALVDGKPIARTIQRTTQGDLIAADGRLAAKGLLTRRGDETRLKMALEPLQGRYDVALLDCPPALGVMSVSALIAADAVVIPMRPDRLSLNALHELGDTIKVIQDTANPRLQIYGIIVTQYNGRTSAHRLMLDEITEQAQAQGITVYLPPIRRTIALEEIQITGNDIFTTPNSIAAQDYQAIIDKMIFQLKGD